jgi:membrane-bound lytic murein transglycosylase D
MPGDKLKIRIGETSNSSEEARGKRVGKEIIYVVKEGDTLWSIARKFNLTVSEIKNWNHLVGGDRIHPEDRLKLRVGGAKSSTLD